VAICSINCWRPDGQLPRTVPQGGFALRRPARTECVFRRPDCSFTPAILVKDNRSRIQPIRYAQGQVLRNTLRARCSAYEISRSSNATRLGGVVNRTPFRPTAPAVLLAMARVRLCEERSDVAICSFNCWRPDGQLPRTVPQGGFALRRPARTECVFRRPDCSFNPAILVKDNRSRIQPHSLRSGAGAAEYPEGTMSGLRNIKILKCNETRRSGEPNTIPPYCTCGATRDGKGPSLRGATRRGNLLFNVLVGDLTVNYLARSHREALHSGDRRELSVYFVGRIVLSIRQY